MKLALSVLLVLGAVRQWRARPEPGEEAAMPKWMAGIDAFTTPKAFGLGALLGGVNPKNLLLSAAAGTTIAQADLSGAQQWETLAIFVVLASVTVAVPVLYYALGGKSAQQTLDGWKVWLQHNNAAVMTVLFLVFAAVLCGQAIQTLPPESKRETILREPLGPRGCRSLTQSHRNPQEASGTRSSAVIGPLWNARLALVIRAAMGQSSAPMGEVTIIRFVRGGSSELVEDLQRLARDLGVRIRPGVRVGGRPAAQDVLAAYRRSRG